QPGYGQPGTQPGTQPGGTQPGGTQPGQTQPGQPAPAGGGQATPVAPAMAAAATPLLTALAASEVHGMTPEAGAFAGQFQDGQTLEQPFNIAPGKCYAVVAAGAGISEVHIQLATQLQIPGLPPGVFAQDNGGSGPSATLGGKGSCWKNPLPIG